MTRALLALLGLTLLSSSLVVDQAFAEDEDSPSSVYLIFDEETGEFIEVDDPGRKRMHQADQEAIESGTTPLAAPDDSTVTSKIVIGAGAALLLAIAALWILRSRSRPPTGSP